jgi:nitrogen fixation protein FixH
MRGRELTGRAVFWIVAGFFAATFAVNTIFVVAAVRSFPGEEEEKSYLQGLAYNDTLARRKAQEALGWRAEAGVTGDGADRRLMVGITSAAGDPVRDIRVAALWRPAGGGPETRIAALADNADGLFELPLPRDARGRGRFEIEVRRQGEPGNAVFIAEKSAILP